ncbi:Nephrocystin-3 [Trichoplax sp. H2]|nr:Nephrocystin-3 [Trichoplax sp. H2]|eukprot:RDD42750.1 Nephrocystin-3 [Trichoplax sp. H2]
MANNRVINLYISNLQQAAAVGNDTLADKILACLSSLHHISWQVIETLVQATLSKFYHQLPDIYLAKLIKIVRQLIANNAHLMKLTAKDDSRNVVYQHVKDTSDKIGKLLLDLDHNQSDLPPLLLYAELQLLQLEINQYGGHDQKSSNTLAKDVHHLNNDCRMILTNRDAHFFDKICQSLWNNPMKLDNLMFYVIIDNFAHIIKSIDNEDFKSLVYAGKCSNFNHHTFGLKCYADLIVKQHSDEQNLLLPLCKLIYELLTLMTHIKPYEKELIDYVTKLQALAGTKSINDMVKATLDRSFIVNRSLNSTSMTDLNNIDRSCASSPLRLLNESSHTIQLFPSPPPLLIDRPQLITAISKALHNTGRCAIIPQDVAIPYGIGKSTLAIQYAMKYKHDYNVIYWLQADNELTLQHDMIALAKRIVYSHAFNDKAITKLRNLLKSDCNCIEFIEDFRNCCVSKVKADEGYASIIKCLIQDVLEKDICGSWLLIYNRVNDTDMIENYIPKTTSHGHAIMVSCRRNWKSNVQVGIFSTEQAVDFLQSSMQQVATYSCNKIAENLLNVPIALTLTTGYVQAKKTTMMDYTNSICTSLTKSWNPVTSIKKLLLTKANKRYETVKYIVLTAWNLNLDEVIQEVPQASEIIAVVGYLSLENVPIQLVQDYYESYLLDQNTHWDVVMIIMQQYKLVTRIKNNCWSIHPWFQLFVREKAHQESKSETILLRLLQLFNQKLNFYSDNYEKSKEIKSFAKYAMNCLKYSCQYDALIDIRIEVVVKICRLFYEFKEYKNTKMFIHLANTAKLLELKQLNNASHRNISNRCLIGYCKLCRIASKVEFMLGNMKDAINILAAALGMISKDSNDNHDIDVQNLQVYLFYDMGVINTLLENYDIAEKNFHQAMETDDLFSTTLLRAADISYQLGIVYGLNNKFKKSVSYLRYSLNLDEEEFGPMHCHVAMDHLELGRSMTLQGKLQQALDHHKQVLLIITQEWKATSNCILTLIAAHVESSRVNSMLHHYSKSLIHLKEALKLSIDHFGQRNLFIASIYYHLGKVYRQMKDLQQSLHALELALEIRSQELDYYNVTMAETYYQLGLTTFDLGMNEQALNYHQKSLGIAENALSDDNLLISDYCLKIGQLIILRGEYKEAIDILERALSIQQNHTKDSDKSHTAAICYEIGIALKEQHQYEDAMDYLKKSCDMDISSHDYFDIVKTYEAIASINSLRHQYNDSISYHQKSLQISIKRYGDDSLNLCPIYDNIGHNYVCLNNFCNAMENYEISLQIKLDCQEDDLLQVAQSYYNCWVVSRKQFKHDQAVHYIESCLRCRSKVLDPGHTLLALTYHDIGLTMRDLKRYKQALRYFTDALDISINCIDGDRSQVAMCYREIGATWFEQGYNKMALEYLELAINIWQDDAIDDYTSNYILTAKLIGQVYLNMAKKALFHRQYYLVTTKIELCERQLDKVHTFLGSNRHKEIEYRKSMENVLLQCQFLKRKIWIQFIRDLLILVILVYGIKVILYFRNDYVAH